jgi:cytochrome c peroxidase
MKKIARFLSVLFIAVLSSISIKSGDIEDAIYFSLRGLPPIPVDKSNYFQQNPDAIRFGGKLFFDTDFSFSGDVSCASCHFTNSRFIANESIPAGQSRNFRTVMQITGSAYNRFYFWDGRIDSLWAQALEPIEHPDEHNLQRHEAVKYVVSKYAKDLDTLMAQSDGYQKHLMLVHHWLTSQNQSLPIESINHVFALIGKCLAAYQASLPIDRTMWDEVAIAKINNQPLTPMQEKIWQGFKIFKGKGRCSACHDGPLFTDFSFHNTAMPTVSVLGIEVGRYGVLPEIQDLEFGCHSIYSDAGEDDCLHLKYLNKGIEENFGAFKTPTLRGINNKTRFGHAGQFSSLKAMIEHYNVPPIGAHGKLINQQSLSELQPLSLTEQEKGHLITFLEAL